MSDQPTPAHPAPQSPPDPPGADQPSRLRLWPGTILVAVLWLARAWTGIGEFAMYKFFVGMLIVPLVVLVGVLVWWLLASRLRRFDRLLVVGAFVAVTAITMVSADVGFRRWENIQGMAAMLRGK